MLRLADCAERDDVGPKARRLACARRAGLPVPDGWVVLPGETPTADELESALAGLVATPTATPPPIAGPALAPGPQVEAGEPRFAVRSSAAVEDGALRSAAGLFASLVGVQKAEVREAIAAVQASADSDAVRSYLGADATAPVRMAVLIQPMVAAAALGVLYLRPDGSGTCEERPPGTPEWADATVLPLSGTGDPELYRGAQALAALVAHESEAPTTDGERPHVYIEYARAGSGVVFLQVRPAPAAAPPVAWPSPPAELAGDTLLFDADHNPDPLSSAQAGLVDCVADLSPRLRQWVCRRYLYYAQRSGSGGSAKGGAAKELPIQSLHARFEDEIRPQCEALLAPLEARLVAGDGALRPELLVEPQGAGLSLAEALSVYRGVYERYVETLGPALRKARQHLDQLLQQNLGEPLSAHGALLAGAAAAEVERLQALYELGESLSTSAGIPIEERLGSPLLRAYLARYGAYARCWDVAVPCDDERGTSLLQTATRLYAAGTAPRAQHATAQDPYHQAFAALLDRLPRMARGALKALLPTVRSALSIAEDDDLLFFRAQRLTRWALLSLGGRLVAAGRLQSAEQVFELPLALAERLDADPLAEAGTVNLGPLAAAGLCERDDARALVPPSRWRNGQPLWPVADSLTLRGCGIPGRDPAPVRGRATVVRSLDAHLDSTAAVEILVLPALIPSWAATLWQARALVTDSGGALAHGALLARERGLPAVVGTRTATRTIRDGQLVWVDAQRGRVHVF